MKNKITVFLDGTKLSMTKEELIEKNYNVRLAVSNGYSHYYTKIVPFDIKHIKNNEIWCTEKEVTEFEIGSSEVSFS